MIEKDSHLSGIIKSLGLVFGDIGTSPLYTLSVLFLLIRPTPEHVIGILSLIIWKLVDGIYLLSNTYKIPHGGYWSIILATIPFGIIIIYTRGQIRLHRSLRPLTLEHFLESICADQTD